MSIDFTLPPLHTFDPSMSAEQMPLEQGVLNKTIEQKMNSPSVYWTKQQLNNCRLNTEQNQLNKSLIEQDTIEHLHYWTVVIWTLPKNQLNKVWIEQISIEPGFIVSWINIWTVSCVYFLLKFWIVSCVSWYILPVLSAVQSMPLLSDRVGT